ncbi:MAG: hypothetical protein M0Q22_07990 [Sulfuritalea sp.]|jgi:hypothetical protein|nr:hypothetical protein [Sulfuritalea sp.]
MEQLIASVQDWPVIVQGALGSALFALVLFTGQKITTYFLDTVHAQSKRERARQLREQLIRYKALKSKDNAERAFYAAVIWLRASRHVVKAFIWLTLGLAFNSLLGVLGVVGFLGATYYLFVALGIVKGISYDGDVTLKIEEIRTELRALNEDGDL